MEENPDWSLGQKALLIEKGLVDDGSLAGWKGADDLPVTGVSWFAATAYCEWLSSGSGAYRFGLPSEAMWEAAARTGLADEKSGSRSTGIWFAGKRSGPARAGSAGYDKSGIATCSAMCLGMELRQLPTLPRLRGDKLQSSERSVGAAPGPINQAPSAFTPGGLEPARCTPYLGFRPVLLNHEHSRTCQKVLSLNRRARFDYSVEESLECGLSCLKEAR
jgi:hypothetical protein